MVTAELEERRGWITPHMYTDVDTSTRDVLSTAEMLTWQYPMATGMGRAAERQSQDTPHSV